LALFGLSGTVNAQTQAASGATVKIPADKITFVSSGIKQHGGEIFLGAAYGDQRHHVQSREG
jgi:hypothetical protein